MHRKTFLGRLWAASVWGPDTIPEEDDRAKPFLQFVIAPYYAVQIMFGYTGFIFGVPAIYAALSPDFGHIWSVLVILVGFMCVITAVFPRLSPRLDGAANSAFAALQGLYVVCLMYLAFFSGNIDGHAGDRSALAVRAVGGLLIPIWKTYDNARERKAGAL